MLKMFTSRNPTPQIREFAFPENLSQQGRFGDRFEALPFKMGLSATEGSDRQPADKEPNPKWRCCISFNEFSVLGKVSEWVVAI